MMRYLIAYAINKQGSLLQIRTDVFDVVPPFGQYTLAALRTRLMETVEGFDPLTMTLSIISFSRFETEVTYVDEDASGQ